MKKTAYATLGAVLIVVATVPNHVDGGGIDLALLVVLGLGLLVASADIPQSRRS